MGNVAIFEAATGDALKYVHVPRLLKLADAADKEPHLTLAAVRAGILGFEFLVARAASLVSQRTDFYSLPRIGNRCGTIVPCKNDSVRGLNRRKNEALRRGTKRGRRTHHVLSPQ